MIGDPEAFRDYESKMRADEYQAYRAAWYGEFCHCEGRCLCGGPPENQPRRVRIRVILPSEPPQLTPKAARALLRILVKAHKAQQGIDEEKD